MDFKSLKKKDRKNSLAALTEDLKKNSSGSANKDERFWSLTRDKAQNGSAIIRFLPLDPSQEEGAPWAGKLYAHSWKSENGSWMFENCPTTLKRPCPICDYNTILWNTDDEKKIDIVRKKQKRRLSYVMNICVIDDPVAPKNNGKVFLFRCGAKIFEKIENKTKPKFSDIEAVNVFDLWDGANFRLRSSLVAGFINYDDSEFDNPSPLFANAKGTPDDSKMQTAFEAEYPIHEFMDDAKFKTYDELKKRLSVVLGTIDTGVGVSQAPDAPAAQLPDQTLDALDAPVPELTKDEMADLPFSPDVDEKPKDDEAAIKGLEDLV